MTAASRKLAAVVAADVVGYSRLMSKDEAATLAALRELRSEVFQPAVDGHGGDVVKSMGDGWLISFPSVVDAVQCAVQVQEALAEHPIIKLRVGIHIGDIVLEDEDIFGDGVNVAARLQELADPGAIALSGRAHEFLDEKLAGAFADLGEHELKNIAEPVAVHGWGMTAADGPAEALPLPEKPSIAVLPFDNMSGDPEQSYFSDGLSEDIISSLARVHALFVIARNSSFVYRGTSVDIRQVGRELGVRFVLEGSVRRAGDRIRMTAQLIEAENGNHIWAERYDRDAKDIFAVQDEIAFNVAGAVGSEINRVELERLARQRPSSLGAYELALRAQHLASFWNAEKQEQAREFAQRAIDMQDDCAMAYGALGFGYCMDIVYGLSGRPPADVMNDAFAAANKAVALDPNDETGHISLGSLNWFMGRHDAAVHEYGQVVKICPNHHMGQTWLGIILGWSGVENYDQAKQHFQMGMRLAPRDPWKSLALANWGVIEFFKGENEAAIATFRQALSHNPDMSMARRGMVAALASSGDLDMAREYAADIRRAEPAFDWQHYQGMIRTMAKHDADAEKLFQGLRLAGLPIDG